MNSRAWVAVIVGLFVGCGGVAVVDPGGGGGDGTTTGTGAAPGVTVTSSTTGGGCDSGEDCPPDSVCHFATGTCILSCDGFVPCPSGEICDDCATSSCPVCDDCIAGCLPAPAGACDDHDDCGEGQLCNYTLGVCAERCGPEMDCTGPGEKCQGCGTTSCPSCKNCLAICVSG